MNLLKKTLFIIGLFSLFLACDEIEHKGRAPKIPLEDFFRNPEMTSFQLSKSGEYFAFRKSWNGRMNIYVQQIGAKEAVRITNSQDRDIYKFFWANDNRLIYLQDEDGNELFHLIAVNRDGTNIKDLTPFDSTRTSIVCVFDGNPDEILIQMNKRDKRVFDVYNLNVKTGEMKMTAKNPGNISRWVADRDGLIRLASTTDGVNTTLLYRQKENQEFEEVLTTNYKESIHPIAFTFDNRYIYAISNLNRNTDAIVRFDIENAREAEIIFEDPEVDVTQLFISDKRRILTGVAVIKDRMKYHFFDNQRKKMQKLLQKKLPDQEIWVESVNWDENRVIARTYDDRTRGAYYYFDMDNGDFIKLAEISPWLNKYHLAFMTPIKYLSRDSLTIHGYLTLPVGVEAKNLPVVVYPHGGPWTRDRWGFNEVVQFLANRGYAVLQVNYRGSSGYGKDFWTKGFKQWGGAMQDDVTDGVRWLIDEGVADSSRIAIFGSSFGGYVALEGLIKTPDIFCCGISYVGITNIFTFLDDIPPAWENYREMLYEIVGHPKDDEAWLHENSPYFHVDKIKAPVFIAQGANDPKVDVQETEVMVKKLKQNGIEVQYMIKEDEGHGYLKEENRIELYKNIEKFLKRNIK